MKIYISILKISLIFSSLLWAQQNSGAITGKIIAAETKEPIAGVNIHIVSTLKGTSSDSKGMFFLGNLNPGIYNLTFSFIGYTDMKMESIAVTSGKSTEINVRLSVEILSLKEIVVTPGSYSIMGKGPVSRQTLGSEQIKNISFSEDITRAVSRLPGVASNDFAAKFTVRGGEADEVLMNLDGMDLYEPFHQRDFSGGLFSIVDIETIEGIDLLTGGFSAEYGDRQSAVFNMRTKEIADDQSKTSLGLSITNARIYHDGTFNDNSGKYLLSLRRGMLDQSLKLIGEEERLPTYYDMMAKVDYKLNEHNSLSLHALHSGDKTAIRDIAEDAYDKNDTRYNNSYGWLTLKSFINKQFYARTMLYGGLINHERNGDTDKGIEYSDKLVFKLKDKRSYNFFGIKQDWDWDISKSLFIKSGFDVKGLQADYDYSYELDDWRISSLDSIYQYNNTIDIKKKPSGQQANFYLSARHALWQNLFIEPGVRWDYTSYTNDNLISPRLGLVYAFSNKTFIRAAWGYYYQSQFINNLDVNHNNASFDPAELSKHYVAGFEHTFGNGINLRLDGYYKDISNLSPNFQNLRDPWEVFPEQRNDIVKLTYKGASAKGIELFIKYDMGEQISWWFSYALAHAEENIKSLEFDGILTERTGNLPRINNQLHTIYGDLNYRPNNNWHFNLSWQYYVGLPLTTYEYNNVTLPDGNNTLHFYQIHHTFREDEYPAYHRLDLRINRHFYFEKSKLSAYLHLINLYNRENLKKYDVDVTNDAEELEPNGQGGYNYFRDDTYWLGLIPAIGISWEF